MSTFLVRLRNHANRLLQFHLSHTTTPESQNYLFPFLIRTHVTHQPHRPFRHHNSIVAGHPSIRFHLGTPPDRRTKPETALSPQRVGTDGYFTPPWVIDRLGWLNGVYERRYEGLGYIRKDDYGREVMEEMEGALGVEKAQGPEWKEGWGSSAGNVEARIQVGGVEWLKELERAVGGVILIAKDRVGSLVSLKISKSGVRTISQCVDTHPAASSPIKRITFVL